jgi:RTX calcium-binding nonapeptide repeat (4 copies)
MRAGIFALGLGLGLSVPPPEAIEAHDDCQVVEVFGTPGPDNIDGDYFGSPLHNHHDHIYGYAGDDVLRGLTCRDVLKGSDGWDELRGATGSDDIQGGNGRDLEYGGNGNDEMTGGEDSDTIISNSTEPDDDSLHGNAGPSDGVDGADGDVRDTVNGGPGNDDTCWRNVQGSTGNKDATGECETTFDV